MNKKQLLNLGVPADCVPHAIVCAQVAARAKGEQAPKKVIAKVVATPEVFVAHEIY